MLEPRGWSSAIRNQSFRPLRYLPRGCPPPSVRRSLKSFETLQTKRPSRILPPPKKTGEGFGQTIYIYIHGQLYIYIYGQTCTCNKSLGGKERFLDQVMCFHHWEIPWHDGESSSCTDGFLDEQIQVQKMGADVDHPPSLALRLVTCRRASNPYFSVMRTEHRHTWFLSHHQCILDNRS